MMKVAATNVHTYVQTEQKEPKAVMRKTKKMEMKLKL